MIHLYIDTMRNLRHDRLRCHRTSIPTCSFAPRPLLIKLGGTGSRDRPLRKLAECAGMFANVLVSSPTTTARFRHLEKSPKTYVSEPGSMYTHALSPSGTLRECLCRRRCLGISISSAAPKTDHHQIQEA